MSRLPIALLGCFFSAALVSGEADPPPNAALQYWQAFSFFTENGKYGALFTQAAHAPAGDERTAFVNEFQQSLRLLHRGAAIKMCDWGIDTKLDGPGTLMPHLPKCRLLAKAAMVAAKEAFDAKKDAQALDYIFDTVALARHASRGKTLICKLIEVSIDSMAFELLASEIPRLPKDLLSQLDARFEALPPPTGLAESLQGETAFLDYFERKAGDTTELKLLLNTLKADLGNDTVQLAMLLALAADAQLLRTTLAEARVLYAELIRIAARPYPEFPAAVAALEVKMKSNLIARTFMPALGTIRETSEADVCSLLLLRTGIRIVSEDKRDANATVDPYAQLPGAPFGYLRLPDGFELISSFQRKGNRVSLRFAPFFDEKVSVKPVRPPKPPVNVENF